MSASNAGREEGMVLHTTFLIRSSELGWLTVREVLQSLPEVRFGGEATSAGQARDLATKLHPDSIIAPAMLDKRPILPLLSELHRGCCPVSKLVVLATRVSADDIAAYVDLGVVCNLLWPDLSVEGLRRCLAAVLLDDIVIASHEVYTRFIEVQCRSTCRHEGITQLNEREQAVLQRLAEGLTQEQIAKAEPLSERAVQRIIAALRDKLDVPNSIALAAKAAQMGLIRME